MLALLILSLLWPAQPVARLVFVDGHYSAEDDWTPERAAQAEQATREALAWWAERTGADVPALETSYATVENPYLWPLWMEPRPEALTIYIVAHRPLQTFADGHSGLGWPDGRVLALEKPAHAALAPLLAHELGHAVYGLPDLPSGMDIMAPSYPWAYEAGRVGCASLEAMGRPCWRVGLPMVIQ